MPSNRILAALSVLALAVGQWFIWAYAPLEETMGLVQKIFYIHMPLAWWALVSFFVVFCASIRHLMTRSHASDILAGAAAEIGVLFSGEEVGDMALWQGIIAAFDAMFSAAGAFLFPFIYTGED